MTTQGGSANRSGKAAEDVIACIIGILRKKGYSPVEQKTFDIKTLYSDTIRVDFFVLCIPKYEDGLIISSKRQEVSGSTEQKIEADIRMIKENYPHPTILIMVGEGWKGRVKKWALTQVDKVKLVMIFFNYNDLLKWLETVPKLDPELGSIIQAKTLPLWSENEKWQL